MNDPGQVQAVRDARAIPLLDFGRERSAVDSAGFQQALQAARLAIDTAPAEWAGESYELDAPTPFNPEAARATLARCATHDLWMTT